MFFRELKPERNANGGLPRKKYNLVSTRIATEFYKNVNLIFKMHCQILGFSLFHKFYLFTLLHCHVDRYTNPNEQQ